MASTSREHYTYSLIDDQNVETAGVFGTMGRNWDKFRLLMWKNWVLQFRRPIRTSVEILVPVLFSVLLVVIRSLVDPSKEAPVIYSPFCLEPIFCHEVNSSGRTLAALNFSGLRNMSLAYSPATNEALSRSMSIFSILGVQNIYPYNNSGQLEAHFVEGKGRLTLAGVQLDDSLANQSKLPDDVEVIIRFPGELRGISTILPGQNNWHTDLLYPVFQTPGPRAPTNNTGAMPGYFMEGFLTLQLLLTYVLAVGGVLEVSTPTELLAKLQEFLPPVVKMQRFPYAAWTADKLLVALESFVGLLILLSFVYTCINTVKIIATEKEKQLKESMKIMGLPNWLHWTAWFLKSFIFLFVSVIFIIVLLKVTWYPNSEFSVFTYADPSVMFVFLILYMFSTITFCFAISVFFSKANTAAVVAGLMWFISYTPYSLMMQRYSQLSLSSKLFASLGSNTAMAFGFQLMVMFEGTGEGIQWSNVGRPNTPDDDLTLLHIMMMLVVDTLIYLLVALYVEGVFPGEYGVPLPWYFPFTSAYWCGHPRTVAVANYNPDSTNNNEFFEKEPDNLTPGVQIKNIRKVFGKKVAVRDLTLNMYNDQITVLLGHNGAGKTTTMSMLTGMFPPTNGMAIISGHDIREDMPGARSSLGLCPQHNIIFDDLTVREHLYFFSKLKGLKASEVDAEIAKYVELLELQPKENSKSETLSGGMKRKLCVGMALCGNSKVVMLDEPTAGMDPSARRALWALLQNQKQGRTMLLTTHFMDEADLLGDRIAIMAGGKLQCCGSSFFLKKKYGAGYRLIMDKSPSCDPKKITDLLKKHISNIQMHGNIGSELTYLLPEDQAPNFEKMLKNLEQSSNDLGIRSYGISLTTLEEVFMKVGADHGQEENYNVQNGVDEAGERLRNSNKSNNGSPPASPDSIAHETKLTIRNTEPLTGLYLIGNQFLAMFMKRILSIARSWILLAIQILMTVAFILITILASRSSNSLDDLPKLPITLNSYEDPITLLEVDVNSSYSNLYRQVLGRHKIEATENITGRMLDLTEKIPSIVRTHYIAGATFSKDGVTAWFNNNPYHSPPLALGLVMNTIFKNIVGDDKNIRFANHPLPFTADTKVAQLLQVNTMGFQLAFNIAFCMAMVSSFYIMFYIKERVCKSKHLQYVSGVKVLIFWAVAFICDIITFLLTIIALIIVLVCFQLDGFKSAADLGRLFFILFYFGVAMLPMMYFASYLFQIPSTGYSRMAMFCTFTGAAGFLVVQILLTPGMDLENVADILHWILLIIPHYALAAGIKDSYATYNTNEMCHLFVENCMEIKPNSTAAACWDLACHGNVNEALSEYCCSQEPDYYKWKSPGIGRNIFFSCAVGIGLFLLLIVIDYKIVSKVFNFFANTIQQQRPQDVPDEDGDVREEKLKIRSSPQNLLVNEYTLVLKDLTKYYGKFLAVNGLSLGIKSSECFGLLGVNGAGKTSTFKMITGDARITYGEAWVEGLSIRTQIKTVQQRIGYCPQFDALLDDLTAKETLMMFALLRGIRRTDCKFLAEKLAYDFDFYRHIDKKVKDLSGGNKRKLSTAISLIGDPSVIYLDEPTTGMDPATKRFLWDVLCKFRDNGKCIVLTSHSMEECEALCTRLAIMVNGNFKCLGSVQHLKSKFSEGYTLTIKVKKLTNQAQSEGEIAVIERFISDSFPKAVQREKHQELLTYYIVDKSKPWSTMFGILEKGKKQLNIEDYSLGQSSLEQVFLTFTKYQQ